jgi:hypothetical protein
MPEIVVLDEVINLLGDQRGVYQTRVTATNLNVVCHTDNFGFIDGYCTVGHHLIIHHQ